MYNTLEKMIEIYIIFIVILVNTNGTSVNGKLLFVEKSDTN